MIKDDATPEDVASVIGADDVGIDESPDASSRPVRRDPMDYRVFREMLLHLATRPVPPPRLDWPLPVELDIEWIEDDGDS